MLSVSSDPMAWLLRDVLGFRVNDDWLVTTGGAETRLYLLLEDRKERSRLLLSTSALQRRSEVKCLVWDEVK